MRTTIDIDDPILKEIKKIQQKEGKSLGRLVSDLLVRALKDQKPAGRSIRPPQWISRPMGARVDLADRDAVYTVMEHGPPENQAEEKI